ncbi:MAG: DUF3311 domain-containing protein [Bacillota bacterium]|nr:DUF3311 domain-containing protein [Bacillota bacterium]
MKNRLLTVIIGLIVPICAITVCFPIYNRIEPFVFGLSFNYAWLFAWLFITSFCLFICNKIDPLNRQDALELEAKKVEEAKALIAKEEGGAK